MATEIRVPALGESVMEATVGRWLKQVGDSVALGETLVELETDKVNTELAAEEAGVLASILHREGETVRPGDTLGTINAQAEAAVAPAANGASPAAESTPAAAADEPRAPNPTPLAQRVAEDLQVDVSRV